MKECVFPGTFDPMTLGHLDLIKRASALFEKVNVLLLINDQKQSMFTLEQRKRFVTKAVCDLQNITVKCYNGLLTNYLTENNLKYVVRGVRNSSDFNSEMLYYNANKVFYKEIEILWLPTSVEYMHISSSLTREILKYKGDLSNFVPDNIINEIKNICNY